MAQGTEENPQNTHEKEVVKSIPLKIDRDELSNYAVAAGLIAGIQILIPNRETQGVYRGPDVDDKQIILVQVLHGGNYEAFQNVLTLIHEGQDTTKD